MKWYISTRARFGLALAAASIGSAFLCAAGSIYNGNFYYAYLCWNLFLAWVPLGLVLWLEKILRRKIWSSWQALLVTTVFVAFLPNTFYMATDFIHLQETPRVDLVFDVITLMSFTFNAFILGLVSIYMFHIELRRRLSVVKSWVLLGALIFLASFAIYIGRDLRWNSWDILLNPASILFEVSDRLLAPLEHPELFATTFGFFVLIGSSYGIVWFLVRAARQQKLPD